MKKGVKKDAQSAMEYLTTYGLAIVIILVVLLALFKLNLFATGIGPRAQPGGCQVSKPYGSNSTIYAKLEGSCTGALPLFVESLNTSDDYPAITVANALVTNTMTISIWGKTSGTYGALFTTEQFPNMEYYVNSQHQGIVYIDAGSCGSFYLQSPPFDNTTWHMFTMVLNGQLVGQVNGVNGVLTGSIYVDGKLAATNTMAPACGYNYGQGWIYGPPLNPFLARIHIGWDSYDYLGWHSGYLSNFQYYNTTLSSNTIQALYQEGIGGAPININNLVMWLPLNGNLNDYSGNGNNGFLNSNTYDNGGPTNPNALLSVSYSAVWLNNGGYPPR